MEVKIGIRDIAREVVVETDSTPDAIAVAVNEAIKNGTALTLTDDKGRQVFIPGGVIGYVEIGSPESRRVGFGQS